MLGSHKAVKLSSFVNEQNKHLAEPLAIDLIEKMMVYDHVSMYLSSKQGQQLNNAWLTLILKKSDLNDV